MYEASLMSRGTGLWGSFHRCLATTHYCHNHREKNDDSDDDDNLEHGDEDDDTRSPISYHCLIQCYIHPEMILFYEGHAIYHPCG